MYAVVDASRANTGTVNQRALLIGQMLTGATAAAGVPAISAGLGDAQQSFGAGSMLSVMVERYRALDPFGELWCLPLADAVGSAAAAATVTFTGTATAAGVFYLYVNGNRVPVAVNSGDTAAVVAASAATAVGSWSSPGANPLSVTAAAATGVLTLTARNKGTVGNQATILLNFGGIAGGDGASPGTLNIPGLTTPAIAPFAGGTIDPSIANALPNLASVPYDFICCPYNDVTSLNAVRDFLGDTAGRWNWSSQLFGHCFSAYSGTFGARTTFGASRNNQHESIISSQGSPSPAWFWATDFTATSAVSLRADPALPVGGLNGGRPLNVVAPPVQSLDTLTMENSLLYDGLTTYVVVNGQVLVGRAITTYQLNAGGAPDNSYLDINVPMVLQYYIRDLEAMLRSQFNQVKLVADGSRIPVGQAMVTAQTIKYSVVAHYQGMVRLGLMQNPGVFLRQVQAQNAGNGVVRLLLPAQLANALYQIVMNVQFVRP